MKVYEVVCHDPLGKSSFFQHIRASSDDEANEKTLKLHPEVTILHTHALRDLNLREIRDEEQKEERRVAEVAAEAERKRLADLEAERVAAESVVKEG